MQTDSSWTRTRHLVGISTRAETPIKAHKRKSDANTQHTGWQHGPSWSACKHADSLTTSHQRWYFPIIYTCIAHTSHMSTKQSRRCKADDAAQSSIQEPLLHRRRRSSWTPTKKTKRRIPFFLLHHLVQLVPCSSVRSRVLHPSSGYKPIHSIQHASHYSHAHALSYCTKSVCVSVTCVCAIFRIPLYWQDVCVLLCTAVH